MNDPDVLMTESARFGAYEIVRLMARGGMGAVYEARHVQLNRRVALKALHRTLATSSMARERFLREGQAASMVEHPNIVAVTDVGVSEGIPFLVMEYLAGHDLAAEIVTPTTAETGERRTLSVERVAEIMVPVCAAVAAAHRVGVIHRDLKPQNIFLARTATGQEVPKVVDFGISTIGRINDLGQTPSADFLGTPLYMSPEQVTKGEKIGPASDQYALGVILYECVTGRQPFRSDTVYASLRLIDTAEYPSPRTLRTDLPEAFEAVILRAMSQAPGDRFGSVDALARALLPFGDAHLQRAWEPMLASGETEACTSTDVLVVAQDPPRAAAADTLNGTSRELKARGMVLPSVPRSRLRLAAALLLPLVILASVWSFAHRHTVGATTASGRPTSLHVAPPVMPVERAPVEVLHADAIAPTPPPTTFADSPQRPVLRAVRAGIHPSVRSSRVHSPPRTGTGCRLVANGAFECPDE